MLVRTKKVFCYISAQINFLLAIKGAKQLPLKVKNLFKFKTIIPKADKGK